MTNCKNCNEPTDGKYCSNCGQGMHLKRIDGHYILHEIEHIVHFERGILYTVKELLIHPGQTVREFINENRNRLVKPIIFIIITSLIYTLTIDFFHIEEAFINFTDDKDSSYTAIFTWLQGHYGYTNLMMGIFIAFWTKLFFKKYQYNFFEILILLCFVIGITMLIYACFGIIQGLTHIKPSQFLGITGFIYTTWAIAQFFDKTKVLNYVKALFAYVLGMVTFILTALILGSITDLIIK
jgi:hypothetical protein